ncbi:MAG: glycosyltransferase [Clostridia bacterium]|nr:glycosyltransferase [Clostridia bacterium]
MDRLPRTLMTTNGMGIGGAETHIFELSRELVSRGIDVTVASAGGVYADELLCHGIRHIEIPFDSRSPADLISAYRKTDALLSREHFDIVHAHARIPAMICSRAARKHSLPFITTAHLDFKVDPFLRYLSRWGKETVAVSDDIKEYLVREYRLSPENITVTVNGVDTKRYSPSSPDNEEHIIPPPPKGRRILSVSRLDRDRSYTAFLLTAIAPDIYPLYPDSDILIVGDGDDMARIRAVARAANELIGREYVKLTGPRTDIDKILISSDIFVGVSRAALEAMAAGKPTILSGDQGYMGIYTEDKLALAAESNFCCRGRNIAEPRELNNDIIRLLSMSDKELKALGHTAKETVEKYYSVKKMADDYMSVYSHLLT